LRRLGADLAALAALQKAILARAAGLVRPGGRVVFAVCSVLREEAEDVVATAADAGLVPAPFDADVAPWGEGRASFRLLPHEHGTDGYFVTSFVKA
jgi:16S rRNA (cytosine967-C5)-methyltransferase